MSYEEANTSATGDKNKGKSPNSEDEILMTSSQAAPYLGISQGEFNRRAKLGKIKHVKGIVSRWRRYRKADLDEYRLQWEAEQELRLFEQGKIEE